MGTIISSIPLYGRYIEGYIPDIGENSSTFGYYLPYFTSKVSYKGRYGRMFGASIRNIRHQGTNIRLQL